MERNDLIARKLFIPAAARWRRTAGPGHACQRQGKEGGILRWECASEDGEGRSSAVPLMVSAQELKCMLLTAWEPVRTRGTTPPAQRRQQAEKTRGRGPSRGVIEPPPPFYALK